MNDVATFPEAIESDAACSIAIGVVGDIDHALARIATNKSEMIAIATATAENEATPLLARKATLEARIAAWCLKERARLTGNGSTKTIGFSSGCVSWRLGKPTVQIDEALKDFIILQLRKARGFYDRFTSQAVSLSKAKMMAATDAEKLKLGKIRGIRFVDGQEAFRIEPAGGELADRPHQEEQAA